MVVAGLPRFMLELSSYLPTPKPIPDSYSMMKKVALVALIVCIIAVGGARAQEHAPSEPDGGAVKVQMHNVMYHFTDQIAYT